MTLEESFITNLVSQQIPMINEWLMSMHLSIDRHTQLESSVNRDISSEFSGYSLFDSLGRGYIYYKPSAEKYSSETHYLLGMYLRALKQLKNLDALGLYNCISSSSNSGPNKYHTASIISKRVYAIYANTLFDISLNFKYSTSDEILASTKITKINPKSPCYVLPYFGSLTEEESEFIQNIPFDILPLNLGEIENYALQEFLECTLVTNLGVNAAVVEVGLLSELIEEFKIGDFSKWTKSPQVGAFYSKYSPKLIQFLTDTLVSDESNTEIKKEALRKYPEKSIATAARKYLKEYNFYYDIDDFIDKRLPV